MEHSNKLFRERGVEMSDENLIIIVGPSGAGKTCIAEKLEELLNIKNVVSSTTRGPRPNEVDGRDYNFYSHEEFFTRVEKGEFVEYAEPFENRFYGTRFEDLNNALSSGGLVLLVVEMEGVESIKRVYSGAQTFFVTAPRAELVRRLEERPVSEKERNERIAKLDKELAGVHSCLVQRIIDNSNGNFDWAVRKIHDVILSKVGYSYARKEL